MQDSILNDLDNDGDLDLVYSTPQGLAWAKNEGSDGFIPQESIYQTDGSIESFAITDTDFDGDKDVYFAESGKLGFGILKNNGSENFEVQIEGSELASPQALSSSVGMDLDEDGDTDLVSVSGDKKNLDIHVNNSLDWKTSDKTSLPLPPIL